MNEPALIAEPITEVSVQSRIRVIRDVQVILDKDLAELYGVSVKRLNEQVKRNLSRFPADFMFKLTKDECLRSQIATLNGKRGEHSKYMPYAFTESGIAMLSSVVHSETAISVNIRIMRAFVAMRHALLTMSPLLSRIEATERRQIVDQEKNNANQARNEERFAKIFDAMSDKKFPPQKVFFDGEFFDAFVQMKKFIRQAKRNLVVIDPYFDDSCLPLIAQKRPGVKVTVVRASKGVARGLHAEDVAQFNRQYADSLTVKLTDKFHDRYLIIDNATLIHVGASLNCLGKRCFAFSMLDASFIPDIMSRVG